MCDRTQELLQITTRLDPSKGSAKSTGLYSGLSSSSTDLVGKHPKTAFNEAASEIAKGVHKTSALLAKLTNLVRRQGLFDDPTEEINSLIFRIKQDLDDLNNKCDAAQQYVDSKKSLFGSMDQSSTHNVKVVSHLKTDLMHTTKNFKSVLELRSSKMKDQQVRKVDLVGKGMLSPMKAIAPPPSNDSHNPKDSYYNGTDNGAVTKRRANQKSSFANPYSVPYNNNSNNHMAGHDVEQSSTTEQMLLLDPIADNQYYESREKAVTEVEKTIGELGNLFNRLATMISEQQELVERVDEDVESAVASANQARDVLMKAYEKVSSNTAMYMKIAAILGVFILFFVLFMM